MSKAPNQLDPRGSRFQSNGDRFATITGNSDFGLAHITCTLELQSWSNKRKYQRLFFLDEATALASGYRPCGTCSKPEMKAFKAAWSEGTGFGNSVGEIDKVLQSERGKPWKSKIPFLPNGTMIEVEGDIQPGGDGGMWLIQDHLYRWSPSGYEPTEGFDIKAACTVLTPPSIVKALEAGYVARTALDA